MTQVRKMIIQGWRPSEEEKMQPFIRRMDELSVHDGCILWGSRVAFPDAGHSRVLEVQHKGHPGVSRVKSLARSIVRWPGIDAQLEEKVKECSKCQVNSKSPSPAPLHPWEWPTRPWARASPHSPHWTISGKAVSGAFGCLF